MKGIRIIWGLVVLTFVLLSVSCSKPVVDDGQSSSDAVDKQASSTDAATTEEKYVHGEDGYFELNEEGAPVHMRVQDGGTCWAYAAAVSLETGYELENGKEVEIDPLSIVTYVYDKDREEGIFTNSNPMEIGGVAAFVVMSLSNGFDGYVLTRGIDLPKYDFDTIKEYIKKYGAMNIGIPDTVRGTMGNFRGYSTLNCVTDDPETYDHSIAIVGWDDHFPKKYFRKKPLQDGAWLTANSQQNSGYYYVSYDTKPDFYNDTPMFMSMSDEYSDVATHDWICDKDRSIKQDKSVTVANVFKKKGTLSAVGTYSFKRNQDITIEIYDDKLEQCLYTQKEHLKDTGYQVVKLNEKIDVADYAIAITYESGIAPVEGPGWKEHGFVFKATSKEGESFIKLEDKWYDLHEQATLDKIGRKAKTNNCCIKGLY